MKVTPREIRQQQFRLRFRGCDPTAVDAFLELIAGVVEGLLKENDQLREALTARVQEIQDIRAQEKDWKKALTAVQQTAALLIGRAEQHAQSVMAEAEHKAQQMLTEVQNRREAMHDHVQQLMRQRGQLAHQIRSFLEQHLKLLEAYEDGTTAE
jgi:cell division initiation protein